MTEFLKKIIYYVVFIYDYKSKKCLEGVIIFIWVMKILLFILFLFIYVLQKKYIHKCYQLKCSRAVHENTAGQHFTF